MTLCTAIRCIMPTSDSDPAQATCSCRQERTPPYREVLRAAPLSPALTSSSSSRSTLMVQTLPIQCGMASISYVLNWRHEFRQAEAAPRTTRSQSECRQAGPWHAPRCHIFGSLVPVCVPGLADFFPDDHGQDVVADCGHHRCCVQRGPRNLHHHAQPEAEPQSLNVGPASIESGVNRTTAIATGLSPEKIDVLLQIDPVKAPLFWTF